MKKKKVIAAFCYAAALLCLFMAVYGWIKEKQAGSSYEDLRETVTITAGSESGADAALSEEEPIVRVGYVQERPGVFLTDASADISVSETLASKEEDVYIDFEELQQLCPDAYAWIRVPGTNVDYPIVQSPTDNTFYLDHNPQGAYEYAGAIFTEDYNSTDFEDPNTVIYGHNMQNGTMFQTLHRFEDKEFFDEHTEFEICLPDRVLHYRIFAAYTYDDRHLLRSFDFTDENVYRLYLKEILGQKSMGCSLASDVEVTAEDKIVTLSTCNGIDDQRYLVQGVLLSE